MKKTKLDIGGGRNKRDVDYIALDMDGSPDVLGDMTFLPFKDESVDEIFSSHTLEHVSMNKVGETLKEWFRVLKPKGKLILLVPNFDYVAKYWLTGPDRAWAEKMVFGLQINEKECHKCAFTPSLLKADLEGCGFQVLRVEFRWTHNQETLQAVCIRPDKNEPKVAMA